MIPRFTLKRQLKKAIFKAAKRFRNWQVERAKKERKVNVFTSTMSEYGLRFRRNFVSSLDKPVFKGGNGRNYSVNIHPHDAIHEAEYLLDVLASTMFQKTTKPVSQRVGWLGIGFERNAVIIEVMQTCRHNSINRPLLNEFRRLSKKPVLNYLLEQAEENARKNGFKQIKIRVPETLYYYEHLDMSHAVTNEEGVRLAMRRLYQKTAREEGYKRKGIFYVKDLV